MSEPHDSCNTITTELPPDILFSDILTRLPAKYLLPSMCVSKQWHSFLRTPMFAQMHQLHHVTTDDHHHKRLVFSTTTPCVFHTIDCESPEDGLSASRPLPFEAASHEHMKVLTSFGGLVCVGLTNDRFDFQYSDLILWNPLTGDYKRLPKPNFPKVCYKRSGRVFVLYYSSCDDDYRLLCVTFDCDAYIYSLKSDAWRNIDSMEQLKRVNYGRLWSASTLLNDELYFLNYYYTSSEPHSVIRFDPKTEKFTVIPTPISGYRYTTCFSHQGHIHLYVAHKENDHTGWSVELWRLDGEAEWKKVVTYPILTTACWTRPLHLMRDGNWVTYLGRDGLVYKIDLASDIQSISCSFTARMYIPSIAKYIETLVSPNRYLS